jgi:hypothetical protein
VGYGAASLASLFLPNTWNKKKLRRSGLLFGGLAGATPGALELARSFLLGQSPWDGSFMTEDFQERKTRLKKDASFTATNNSTMDSQRMLQAVWTNPYVSQDLSHKEKMLLTGAVNSAGLISQSPFVTPKDMARLTAGMGSGYVGGLVAGKVLGTLVGLPQPHQNALAKAGVFAGVVKSTLPLIYGR